MKGRILSVGDCVLDLLCTPLPDLPSGDSQISMGRILPSPGGNSLNFAIAASMVHPQVGFLGAVGDDVWGEVLRGLVSGYPLDALFEEIRASSTATTVAIPDPSGGRRLLTHSGANSVFSPRISSEEMEGVSHFHRGGYWFTERMMGAPSKGLFAMAKEAGSETSMDPATDPGGWDPDRIRGLMDVIGSVDILFLNEYEMKGITGKEGPEEGMDSLLDQGVGSVVLHMGPEGIRWGGKLGRGTMRAFRVDNVLNPTGTGDVFNGVFVALRVSGREFEEAIRLAQAASAIHLSDPTSPYPELDRIEAFASHGSDID